MDKNLNEGKEKNNTKPNEENNQKIIQNNVNTKLNKKTDILIGSLLILPLYIVVYVILISVLRIEINFNPYILLSILMYLPVFIGILLSYKYYGEEASKIFSSLIIFFIVIALFNFYNVSFDELERLNDLTSYYGWLVSSVIARIIACAYYGSLVGKKKALNFFVLYVITVIWFL